MRGAGAQVLDVGPEPQYLSAPVILGGKETETEVRLLGPQVLSHLCSPTFENKRGLTQELGETHDQLGTLIFEMFGGSAESGVLILDF